MSRSVLFAIALVVGLVVGVGGVFAVTSAVSAPPAPVTQTSYSYGS